MSMNISPPADLKNLEIPNDASNFSKMPDEIKAEIFKQLSAYQTNAIRGNLWIDNQNYWIDTARLVCRQWNSLIIHCAWIWRYIRLFYYSDDRLLLHLQRSNSTRLMVDVTFDKVIWDSRLDISENGHVTNIVEKRLWELLDSHIGRIEEFKVNLYVSSWIASWVSKYLVERLFSGNFVSLRRLSLYELSANTSTLSAFENLSSLTLMDVQGLVPQKLLSILRVMTNLERLYLHSFTNAWNQPEINERDKVHLPIHFKFLSLAMNTSSCIQFLRNVILPKTDDISWHVLTLDKPFSAGSANQGDKLAALLPPMKGEYTLTIDARSHQISFCAESFSDSGYPLRRTELDIDGFVDWSSSSIRPFGDMEHLFSMVFLDVRNVNIIFDLENQPVDEVSWGSLFYLLHHVETLKLNIEAKGYRKHEYFLARALGGQSRTPLLKLKQLHLCGFDFSHEFEQEAFSSVLAEVLSCRGEEGYLLDNLYLSNSTGLSNEDVELLSQPGVVRNLIICDD